MRWPERSGLVAGVFALAALAWIPSSLAAETALETCTAEARDKGRAAVGVCLDRLLAEAEAAMAEAFEDARRNALELGKTAGRGMSLRLLEGAQKRFLEYRKAQCDYVAATVSTGTAAADAQRACMIHLTRVRAEELAER